jgi:phosphopantothenoylcysteine decarboxylase/phosphopantothenate--cysteine ligase
MSDPSAPPLSSKRIVLGISASIAAYKAADLASQLVSAGVDVFPILTPDATNFISPLTFQALTGHVCPVSIFDEPIPGDIGHIWYARNTDLIVIAPASMDTIAKLANGQADNMLTGTTLATTAPVLIAPAMNTNMWSNPATQFNLAKLRDFGYYFIEPVSGRLACRTEGVGKLADVGVIFNAVLELLNQSKTLAGKRVLITSGPTREPIDPVRYITNRSSGKMGTAIAEAARRWLFPFCRMSGW